MRQLGNGTRDYNLDAVQIGTVSTAVQRPSAYIALLIDGLALACLFSSLVALQNYPLYHHLCWCKDGGSWTDPDYFACIPDANNYFARSAWVQLGTWLVVALIALGVYRLRVLLLERRG